MSDFLFIKNKAIRKSEICRVYSNCGFVKIELLDKRELHIEDDGKTLGEIFKQLKEGEMK